jgi:hypothetical protein
MALSVFSLGLVAFGLVLLGYGVLSLRNAYRVVRNDPKEAYQARSAGPFEIEGTAKSHEEYVRAPFTDAHCLVCQWKVEEYRHSGKNSHWSTIDEGTWWVPFRVEDDTGAVLVEPGGAKFSLGDSGSIHVDGGTAPPETIRQFIDANEKVDSENRQLDLKLFSLRTGNDRRYTERRLDIGEPVHVLGYARPDPDREFGSRLYAIVGAPAHQRSGFVGRLFDRLVGPLFLISDTTEHEAAKRLLWRAAIPMVVGVVFLLFAVALF